MKLHLGCFDKPLPGWVNTDVTFHLYIARVPGLASLLFKLGLLSRHRYEQYKQGIFRSVNYLNVIKTFPYDDETFEYAFCSHLLEHLYFDDAITCTQEVYRVLKYDGIFRISVPDLDRMIEDYDPSNPDNFLEKVFESKQKRDKNRHHWHYNEVSMTQLLRQAGFSKIERVQFQQGDCADVATIDNRPESLFMEATKI